MAHINGTCARVVFDFTTLSQNEMVFALRDFCERIGDKVHLRPGLTYTLYKSPGAYDTCGKATVQCSRQLES